MSKITKVVSETAANDDGLTQENALLLTKAEARIILEMQMVCLGEGIGPDARNLIRDILMCFPDLASRYEIFATDYVRA